MADDNDIDIIKYREYVFDNSKDVQIAYIEEIFRFPKRILLTKGEIKLIK